MLKTIPQLVGQHLRQAAPAERWEVLNCGVPAYNIENDIRMLEWRGLPYSPDVVVLMLHLNDGIAESDTVIGSGIETMQVLEAYFLDDLPRGKQRLVEDFLAAEGVLSLIETIPRAFGSQSISVARKTEKRYSAKNISYFLTHLIPSFSRDFERYLRRLSDLQEQAGFTAVVVVIPEIDVGWENYPFEAIHRRIAELCERQQLLMIDLTSVLAIYPNNHLMLHGHDGHTSPLANSVIAARLGEVLRADLSVLKASLQRQKVSG